MSRRTRRTEGDVLTMILNKLPREFSTLIPEDTRKAVLIKAREKIRILDSKTTRGVAICAGDSQDIRAAVILEILLREGVEMKSGSRTPSIRIPLEQLGKVVGKGKADTERVSAAVRNLLGKTHGSKSGKDMLATKKRSAANMSLAELRVRAKPKLFPKTFKDIFEKREAKTSAPPITNKPSNKKVANRKRKQTESDRVHSNSKNHDINVQPVHLFELCMRLQSKMFDPNACHKVSSTVYATLVKKMIEEEGRNAVTRKAIIDDLEMNSKQFEGACLFLVNQKLDGGALYDDSSKKKKKSSDDSDDDDACLTMDDIANELRLETSSFEKFVKEISVKIADLMRDMKHQDRKSGKNIQKQISNYDVVDTDDVLKSVADPLENEDSEEYLFVPKEPRNCKPTFINFDEYSKWKQNTLLSLVVVDETVDDATSRAACEISRNLQEEETIMKS